jgi:hypothetical protein
LFAFDHEISGILISQFKKEDVVKLVIPCNGIPK